MDNRKRLEIYLVAVFSVAVLFSCGPGAQLAARLTPQELGTYEHLSPSINALVGHYSGAIDQINAYDRAREAVKTAQAALEASTTESQINIRKSALKRAERREKSALEGYYANLRKLAADASTNKSPLHGRTLYYPRPMAGLVKAYLAFLDVRVDTDAFPKDDRMRLRNAASKVQEERTQLLAKWNARKPDYSNMNGEHALNIQFDGVPVKLNVLNGKFKFSASTSLGPVKVSWDSEAVRGAIKTLIIQDSNSREIFAVGGRPLRLEIPASILETSGSVMTITAIE